MQRQCMTQNSNGIEGLCLDKEACSNDVNSDRNVVNRAGIAEVRTVQES